MSRNAQQPSVPWKNRWTQPTPDALVSHLEAPAKKIFESMATAVEQLEHVEKQIAWYGVAWKWTVQFRLNNPLLDQKEPFCFLIPKEEAPQICVPLSDDLIEALPMRRLNRMIRDGIRTAKCALQTHWATWSPNNQSEINHILDLLRRKREYLLPEELLGAAVVSENQPDEEPAEEEEAEEPKEAKVTQAAEAPRSGKSKRAAEPKSKRSTRKAKKADKA